jgi:hypothetical protein
MDRNLKQRTKQFARRIIKLYLALPATEELTPSSFILSPSSFAYGSSPPFLPFFFCGSASRGRVA